MIKYYYLTLFLIISHITVSQFNYTFSAISGTYNSVESGTIAPLTASFSPTRPILDEGFSNSIPIGFTFQYNSINYNSIHLNTNGFASLGAQFLASTTQDPAYDVNELRSVAGYKVAIKPVLAPFWDNLLLNSATDLTYITSGSAPNRIFTAQWKNAIWQSGNSAISFQLKLYETSNTIEFIYEPQADLGGAGKSASIGISTEIPQIIDEEIAPLTFQSLNSSLPTATINISFETDNIAAKPSSGQIFRFTPLPCMPASGIFLTGFDSHSATINWAATHGATSYEIALSNIDIMPISGSLTATNQFTFNDLAENTKYYFYIKNACGSTWNKFSFKTSTIATLPYSEDFETALENAIPNNMTEQTNNNPFGDSFWQTSDILAAASGTKKVVAASPFSNANAWLFTPSFNLIAGGIYNLSYKISTTGGTNAVEVKLGNKAGELSMTNTITTDNALSNTAYSTKNYNFTPTTSGEHIIGFANKSAANNQIILLDDIALTLISAPLPLHLVYFKASLEEENLVKLNWKTTSETNVPHFEIQKSLDGKSFTEIGKTNSQNTDNKANEYDYYDRKPNVGLNYYRLKMVDLDGKFTFSPIDYVNIKDQFITELYPNPSDKEVFLKMKNTDGISLKAYQIDGKDLPISYTLTNKNEFKITPNEPIKTGIYLVQITSKTETRVLKWVVR
jgi:hypothetical protein